MFGNIKTKTKKTYSLKKSFCKIIFLFKMKRLFLFWISFISCNNIRDVYIKLLKDTTCFMCYEVTLTRPRLIGDCDDI